MTLTPAQITINAEVQGWVTNNLQLAQSNYVIKKLESNYIKNYDVLQSGTSGALTALKELQPYSYTHTPTNLKLRAYLQETQLVAPQNAMLGSTVNMGLITAQGTNTQFSKGVNNYISVTPVAGMLPDCQVGDYLRVRHRVNTQGESTLSTLTAGTDATVQGQVREDTIVPLHTGAMLALEPGVEWPIVSGTDAHVAYNALTSSAVVFSVPLAMFTGTVLVGDFVQLVARTTAPATTDPTLAGYYKVTAVGTQSLLLDRKQYTRTSEGVYTQNLANLPNMSDDLDWHVIRTAQNTVYLRQAAQNFTTVNAGDYVKATAGPTTYIFNVASNPATGLLLLDPMQYAGTSAPYTATTDATSPFSVSCSYTITRAPIAAMASFTLTAATDFIHSNVEVGNFVNLISSSGIDPTTFPANLGYFKITAVTATTLTMDNNFYTESAGVFSVSGTGPVYATYVDSVDYVVSKSATFYPNSRIASDGTPATPATTEFTLLMYQVTLVTTGEIRVDPTRFRGYEDTHFELDTNGIGPVSSFTDFFDIDVIHVYGPQLYVHATSSLANTVLANANTFVVSASTSSTQPAYAAVVTGAFNVTGHPLPNILLLARAHYAGRALEGAGTQFAPYLRSANPAVAAGTWAEPVNMYVTQQDLTTYSRVAIVGDTNSFTDVAVGDYLGITSYNLTTNINDVAEIAPYLAVGTYLKVNTKTNNQELRTTERGYSTLSPLSAIDLNTSAFFSPSLHSSFSANITAFSFKRSATHTTFARLTGIVTAAAVGPGQFVSVTYPAMPTPTIFEVLDFDSTSLFLSTTVVTGSAGVYTVTSTPLTLDMRLTALTTFEVQRPTGALSQVGDYLTAFAASLPSGSQATLNQRIAQLYEPRFDTNGSSYSASNESVLLATATAAIQQVAKYLPDQTFTLRGFAEGGAVSSPVTETTTPAALSALDISQAPTATSNTSYQDMVAVVAVAQYDSVFKVLPVQNLKDIYVDYKLQELGYTAAIANRPITDLAIIYSLTDTLRNAQQVKTSVLAALTSITRTDISTLVDTQLASLIPTIQSTILTGMYPVDKNAYFVVGGPGVDFSSALAGFPSTFIASLGSTSSVERRKAFQVFIAVPAEPSLRVTRRTYARLVTQQTGLQASLTDLQQHRAQTTDPALQTSLDGAITDTQTSFQNDADASTIIAAKLTVITGSVPSAVGTPVSGTDQVAVQNNVNASVGGSDGASAGDFAGPVQTVPLATSSTAALPTPTPITDVTPFPIPVSGVIVTNLFSGDIHDFRVTGVTIPYYTLNSKNNNATNFATLSLAEFDLTGKGSTVMSLAYYGTVPSINGYCVYNQFKMTGLQETHTEKFQIVDTLADTFMTFAYGRRPEVWSMSGTLINDIASDQLGKFRELYDKYLRIGALANLKKKMVLTVPALGLEIFGYAVAFVPQSSSEGVQTVVPFNLQFVVTNVSRLPQITKLNDTASVPISALVKYLHANSGLTTGGGINAATSTSAASSSTGSGIDSFSPESILTQALGSTSIGKAAITGGLTSLPDPFTTFTNTLDPTSILSQQL